jgi:RHS repeat-associated protein
MSRTFDTDGKVTAIASAGNKTYGYDDAFRISSITDTVTPANSYTYGHDGLDRLTSAVKTGTTRGWTYDANGNRLTETGASPSTYTISATNNRVSSISGAVSRTYTYDAAGNTLTYSNITATYNNRGRMKTLKKGSTTATFTYNALGELAKRVGGTPGTVHYVYDEAGHLLGEYNSSGALVQETIWLGDTPVATLRPGTPIGMFYVHTDHLNTPRKITRPSDNQARWTWESDPFGTALPNENPASLGTFKYNLRFPGQLYDAHTGLNYNYFRDYDAVTGRYVQSDPIGLVGGLNTYAYVTNDPISRIDPVGLEGIGYWTFPPGPQRDAYQRAGERGKRCCATTGYFNCLANCIRRHRFDWDAITATNLANTAANAAFGRTGRAGISTPAHSTTWQHRVGAAAARSTGNVTLSHVGRALGRASLFPTIAEGFYDIGTELRCAAICTVCENRDNP